MISAEILSLMLFDRNVTEKTIVGGCRYQGKVLFFAGRDLPRIGPAARESAAGLSRSTP